MLRDRKLEACRLKCVKCVEYRNVPSCSHSYRRRLKDNFNNASQVKCYRDKDEATGSRETKCTEDRVFE